MAECPEFDKFTVYFYQDSIQSSSDLIDVVKLAVSSMSDTEIDKLLNYMKNLAAAPSDNEVQRIWNASKSDYLLKRSGGSRDFANYLIKCVKTVRELH